MATNEKRSIPTKKSKRSKRIQSDPHNRTTKESETKISPCLRAVRRTRTIGRLTLRHQIPQHRYTSSPSPTHIQRLPECTSNATLTEPHRAGPDLQMSVNHRRQRTQCIRMRPPGRRDRHGRSTALRALFNRLANVTPHADSIIRPEPECHETSVLD